jgi:hypothetical protein
VKNGAKMKKFKKPKQEVDLDSEFSVKSNRHLIARNTEKEDVSSLIYWGCNG